MFEKILIANRGEIAVRIMRTCQRLGVKTCAVFSDADRHSRHVQLADEAIYIGASPAIESYLCADKILNAALESNSQAIHPGYGFLSENYAFASLLESNGRVKFIGPPASAILSMGSKSGSKHIMSNAGVPITPGYHGEDQSIEHLRLEAKRIGFPLMLKADAGGGGKGMRIVENENEFEEKVLSCKREAQSSFKDSKILLEKYVRNGRHVEVQVFGDEHNNYVSLFERDCSVQRRHQKVLEEAPASMLSLDMRKEMHRCAIQAAKAVNYRGAGTIEFLVDQNDFYFMEMNTRLQVEHPVTEMITGWDLVEWQLRVACGEALPKQESISCTGHSLEARVYAEHANSDGLFLPGSGPLEYVEEPFGERVETGFGKNDLISIFYDPMIAKLVVHGNTREESLRRMESALKRYRIAGLNTNLDFLLKCVQHPVFKSGKDLSTLFIEQNLKDLVPSFNDVLQNEVHFAICAAKMFRDSPSLGENSWFGREAQKLKLVGQDSPSLTFTVNRINENTIQINLEGQGSAVATKNGLQGFDLEVDRRKLTNLVPHWNEKNTLTLFSGGKLPQLIYRIDFAVPDYAEPEEAGNSKSIVVISPMPGKIVHCSVQVGMDVEKGQILITMEAMKMEHQLKSPKKGKISHIYALVGDVVQDSQELIRVA